MHVVRVLCDRIAANKGVQRTCEVVAGGSKPSIISDAHIHVKALRAKGCQCIVLVWDNCPPWKGNLASESFLSRVRIWRGLKDASLPRSGVVLVCAKRELEAWLLTDDAAIRAVLGGIGRGAMPGVSGTNTPDNIAAPKDRLHGWWYERCGRVPIGKEYAELAAQARLKKLRKSPSFLLFEKAI